MNNTADSKTSSRCRMQPDYSCLLVYVIFTAAWLGFNWFIFPISRQHFFWLLLAQAAITLVLFFMGFFTRTIPPSADAARGNTSGEKR